MASECAVSPVIDGQHNSKPSKRMHALGKRVTSVVAKKRCGVTHDVSFVVDKIIGNGSFGVVFDVRFVGKGNKRAAIKRVLQDRRFKNRELGIMCTLNHVNVVTLLWYYFSVGMTPSEIYLNLAMEFLPETLHSVLVQLSKSQREMDYFRIKVYMYQIFRSLGYIHSLGIAHRDLKPHNILVDSDTGVLKLCDFGSAKKMCDGEPSVCYICSRYYRAPELIFGSTQYTHSVDLWSAGCVFGELLLGQVLFAGENGVDQLVEIIKVLGTPTKEEIRAMNPKYQEFLFPAVPRYPWDKVFRGRDVCADGIDLISTLVDFMPDERVAPFNALSHAYFNELRTAESAPDGTPLPPLFNFTALEMANVDFKKDLLIPASRRDESDI